MKYLRPLLCLAALFALSVPALALDPHEVQSTALTAPASITGSTATSFTTMISLTTTASGVNSGTNSYVITAVLRYTEAMASDGYTSFQITVDGTAIPSTILNVPGGPGYVVIRGTKEGVAASKIIAVQGKLKYATDKLTVHTGASLDVLGLAGATQ